MAAKLTRLIHTIAIQLHLVAESSTIPSSLSRRPVRKLLDTHSYLGVCHHTTWHYPLSRSERTPVTFLKVGPVRTNVFWVVILFCKDGDRMDVRNVGILPHHYTLPESKKTAAPIRVTIDLYLLRQAAFLKSCEANVWTGMQRNENNFAANKAIIVYSVSRQVSHNCLQCIFKG
jgi:hypothetical protein